LLDLLDAALHEQARGGCRERRPSWLLRTARDVRLLGRASLLLRRLRALLRGSRGGPFARFLDVRGVEAGAEREGCGDAKEAVHRWAPSCLLRACGKTPFSAGFPAGSLVKPASRPVTKAFRRTPQMVDQTCGCGPSTVPSMGITAAVAFRPGTRSEKMSRALSAIQALRAGPIPPLAAFTSTSFRIGFPPPAVTP